MSTKPPNIFFVLTDQQSAQAMSCAGNRDLDTPHMDRLAERGVRFTDAYCTHPLCTPSRVSLLTGKMPSSVGVIGNESEWSESTRQNSMGCWFRDRGYRCGFAGKWHATADLAVPDPEVLDTGFERVGGFNDPDIPAACERFLSQKSDQPFLLVASFDNPHNICEAGRDEPLPWGEVASVPPDQWPSLPPNFAAGPYEPQPYRCRRRWAEQKLMALPYTPDRWRRYRHEYFRLVEKVDALLGRCLDALEANGFFDNTVIVFTSDHGEMNASHELGHKQTLYEESVGVPLILSDPRWSDEHHGHASQTPVSNGLDLFPTLCGLAGIDPPPGLLGRDLLPLARNDHADADGTERWIAAETELEDFSGRMIRTACFKYVAFNRGYHREQLFNLEEDPHEQVNLAIESKSGDVLQHHRDLLRQWCVRTGDRFGAHYARPGEAALPGHGWVPLSSS